MKNLQEIKALVCSGECNVEKKKAAQVIGVSAAVIIGLGSAILLATKLNKA